MSESELDRAPGIRPWPSLWRWVDAAGRRILPGLATGVVIVLLGLRLQIAGQAELQQVAAISSVWFWSVYRPLSMPPVAAFGLGLLLDLLGPEPPGIDMVIMVAVSGVALRMRARLRRRGFLAIWLAFVAVSAGAFTLQWGLTAALDWRLLPFAPALLEFGLALGLYPLVASLLIRAHASIAAPERA